MGSLGRSIRLRIFCLVAIPLIAMVGLLAYVASTSINNVINLDRAPHLISATSSPTADFVRYLQDERAAAVIYLFQPTPADLTAYEAAVTATEADQPKLLAALKSPGTKSSETPAEVRGINVVVAGLSRLSTLRGAVANRVITPLQALEDYSAGIQNEPKLFLDEADSLTSATAAGQALGLIAAVSAREALSQEYALLSGVLTAHTMTQADRAAFAAMVATRQGDLMDADSVLDPANLAIFNAEVNSTEQTEVADIEGAVSAGTPAAKLPVTLAQWDGLAGQLLNEYFAGGVNVANAQLADDRQIADAAQVRVAVTGGIGLVGLLLTITVTILVGRGIIRRLGGLERSALELAEIQLPDVVGRLRHGEEVDVTTEAPPLQAGLDEIGRVGQAFDLVRQTAIRAAVEEARLRRGLNDVFRSLARRSQSLLHRQLALLDQMERRATDSQALEDLFRLDHLTTCMRRHAEGLVILAGAPPGRGWSSPVRMVDVMRGAIAEVEDYARVSVATRSQAALAGSAVADVIHLLAELIENATALSPPYTSVRVSGDTVPNGFAIEVEDRGLGMSPQRLAELNERLANPPEFNPSDSEQLGLFVVSQLANRHGIRVTLKASAYDGTSAIVLIPRHLVVSEDMLPGELPGEPAAIGMAAPPTNGDHRSQEIALEGHGRRAAAALAGANARLGLESGVGELPGRAATAVQDIVHGAGPANGSGPPAFDVFMPRRRAQATGETSIPADGGDDDVKGLPRRVKQASLAPQLRADPPRPRASVATITWLASEPAPAEIRPTTSALQRGWQHGRSQRTQRSASDEAPREPSAGASPAASGAGDRQPAPDDKPRGASDGT